MNSPTLSITAAARLRAAAWPEVAALEGRAERLATPAGGGTLVWRRWGRGQPVVLLHGGHGSWTHWLRSITVLAARFTVLVPDLPGMCDSDPPVEPATLETLAATVAQGLAEVVPAGQSVRLVGFSFGGTVAAYMMPLCRERIGALVLMGSSAGGPVNPVSENLIPWRNEPDSDRRRALHRHNLGVMMIADPARIDDQAVDLHAANAERTRLRSRPLHRTADLPAQLRAAPPQRLAALWGARDALLAGHDAERIALLRSFHPEAEVAVVPDTGHWLQYETPGPANAALLGLL